ncbi:MAG: arylsulfatase [Rhizobiales bacterium]|nr:arylsulfatase [Hyphomicrobiales bacterium]
MILRTVQWLALVALATLLALGPQYASPAHAQVSSKPNILFIMGDDVGVFNIGAYHQGIMSGKTPNLDRLASQGMRFTDYYAEASCTAGRANFITGELPIRTGMTTVGQAGADVGLPAQAPTIATALKSLGYTTGQFGKNHLGDLNKYLPCVHGFDQFFGYLYHLDAMSDPYWFSYPTDPAIRNAVGPRNLVRCFASDTDDPTVDPRWGKVGKQKLVDEGPLAPGPDTGRTPYGGEGEGVQGAKYDMTTFDEELVKESIDFMKKAKDAGKPFFLWHNTTRMHVFTFLSQKYKAMMNPETNYGLEEAGMAQLDDSVGALMKALDDMGIADNTIVVFSTDNGAEVFTWPDGGATPFKGTKGTAYEGGFRVPAIIRWPGKVAPGKVENGLISGLDWFPTFLAAAGDPNIVDELKAGKDLNGTNYKVHLDGYDQTDLITGAGPTKRHEIWYFVETNLGGLRLDEFKFRFFDQPDGWPGPKVPLNMPIMVNIKQDPFERTPSTNLLEGAPGYMDMFMAREFWRFVYVQQKVAALAQTAIEFPPMQKGASFNLAAVKAQIEEAIRNKPGN